MSNTVKIKNRKKKSEIKVNYKLLAIIFGIFVAVIVGLSVWASFHWGVGMGTIGVRPVTPEEPAVAATGATVDAASEFSTDNVITVTPEQLEKMGINVNGTGAEGAEAAKRTRRLRQMHPRQKHLSKLRKQRSKRFLFGDSIPE